MKKIASNKWGRLLIRSQLMTRCQRKYMKSICNFACEQIHSQKVLWFPWYHFLRNDAFYFLKETYHKKLLGLFFGLWIFHFFVLFNGIRRNAC